MPAQFRIARRTPPARPPAVAAPHRASSAVQPPVARPRSPQADALSGTLARAVKARRAAGPADRVPRPRAAMLMRAGFPAGMMKEHPAKGPAAQRKPGDDPPDWTYHHIIPENVLEAFWEKAEPEAHKLQPLEVGRQGSGALTKLIRRGYRQLREAAVYT